MKGMCIKGGQVLMVLLVLLSCCVGYVLFGITLVEGWIPVSVALALVAFTFVFYRKWAFITTVSNRYVNMLCHVLCVGSIGYMLFLAGNFYFRDKKNPKEVVAVVKHKYSETGERRTRVGRHRYRTTSYREFYIKVTFESGLSKTLDVPVDFYNRSGNDTIRLVVEDGLWGIPVIPEF